MKRTTFVPMIVILVSISLLGINRPCRADDVSLGRQAEQAGKLRQALTHYVTALQSVSEGSPKDQRLREKIIKLAQKIQPPPEILEEVYRYMARGEAFVEAAKDKDGFLRAAREFQSAANAAPWLADAYYNLGVVQDKAVLHKKAIKSLNFYLLAAPDATDGRSVRNLIYKIEARQEEASTLAKTERDKKESLETLSGNWQVRNWTNEAEIPAIDSKHWSDIARNETVSVSIEGNTFEAVYRKPGFRASYRGVISGNRITGSKTDDYSSFTSRTCPPVKFEGTIYKKKDKILIATLGTYWLESNNSCRYDPNVFFGSLLLVR